MIKPKMKYRSIKGDFCITYDVHYYLKVNVNVHFVHFYRTTHKDGKLHI